MKNLLTKLFHRPGAEALIYKKRALYWFFLPLVVLLCLFVANVLLQGNVPGLYSFRFLENAFVNENPIGVILPNLVNSLIIGAYLLWLVSLAYTWLYTAKYLALTKPRDKSARKSRVFFWTAIGCFVVPLLVILASTVLYQMLFFLYAPTTAVVPMIQDQGIQNMFKWLGNTSNALDVISMTAAFAWMLGIIVGIYLLVKRSIISKKVRKN